MSKRIASIAALLLVVISLGATSARADALSVKVDQTYGIADGQFVTVTVENLPADKGIYIVECVLTDGHPSRDPKDCTSPQNVDSAFWVSNGAEGTNPSSHVVALKVLRTINSKDCVVNSCAIVTMRDHVDPTDRSFDSITPIKVSAITFALDKRFDLVDAGDEIAITISGLPSDDGVYVRQCELPADGSRPTNCDNAGAVWASNNADALTQGGVDASKAIPLRVKGVFSGPSGVIDCQNKTCGVYLERDWNGLSDRSLDTLISIVFYQPIPVQQTVVGWKQAPGSARLKVGKTLDLAKKSVKTKQGNPLTWKSNAANVCKVVQSSKGVSVKALKAGNCVVTAKANATTRALEKTFTWKVKVSK